MTSEADSPFSNTKRTLTLRQLFSCSTLKETIEGEDLTELKPFPPGKPELFASFLDKVMGLAT